MSIIGKEIFDVITKYKTKKNDGTYSNTTYIGTDSRFVSMPSGLTLGEESFIGKNAITTISEISDTETYIVESFGKEENKKSFYLKETMIEEMEDFTKITEILKIKLFDEENDLFTEETVRTKETTITEDGRIEEKII